MGDEGKGATAWWFYAGALQKLGCCHLSLRMELGERDSFASLDFTLGVVVASSQRERERERWFKT